jgi:hypothetical protein
MVHNLTQIAMTWEAALSRVFPQGVPERAYFVRVDDMLNALEVVSKENCGHLFLPTRGGEDLLAIREARSDADAVEWHSEYGADNGFAVSVSVARPTALLFYCPGGHIELAHFVMDTAPMERVLPSLQPGEREEAVQLPDDRYITLHQFEYNGGDDEDLVTSGGRFALFSKASPYNSMSEPDGYDALHTDQAIFGNVITALCAARERTAIR